MKTTLCTLYNSLYLDKGLVLYDSLYECARDFELYVLCMDEKCYEVLSDIGKERIKLIHLSDIENEKMLKAKSNRSPAEYCWTCSSRLLQYVFDVYKPEICTYIDADMYFYHDPQILVDEMINAGKSVMITPHRFTSRNINLEAKVGAYCVEFNTFKNDDAGLYILNHWHDQCLECCKNLGDGIHWGDQKYMDEWPIIFNDKVHVCQHLGAGVAPWNIESYKRYNENDSTILYLDCDKRIDVVFFHFQSISYITRTKISTGITTDLDADYIFVERIYRNYLTKIDKAKSMLKDSYNINLLVFGHPSFRLIWWKRMLKKIVLIRVLKSILFKTSPVYYIHLNET